MQHLLNDAPWSYFQKDIHTSEGGVYEGRWGSVMAAVQNLLTLKEIVRGAWNKQRFLAAGCGAKATGWFSEVRASRHC